MQAILCALHPGINSCGVLSSRLILAQLSYLLIPFSFPKHELLLPETASLDVSITNTLGMILSGRTSSLESVGLSISLPANCTETYTLIAFLDAQNLDEKRMLEVTYELS